jgi:hypothetical protein
MMCRIIGLVTPQLFFLSSILCVREWKQYHSNYGAIVQFQITFPEVATDILVRVVFLVAI